MIPVPLIVLGISATTLGARRLRKKYYLNKAIDETRKDFEPWCKSEGMAPKSDGTFDLNAHLPNGNPLVIEAIIQERDDIFEFLIVQGADVNAMNSEGKTALFYCKNNNQIEILIKAGADVNARDLLGKTALFYCKSVDLTKGFISAGIDVNARDLHGRTAIFGCRNVLIADVLLENGADLLIQDEEGKTVLHTLSTAKKDLYFSLESAKIYVTHTPMLMNITDNMGEKAGICKLYLKEEQYEETLDNVDKKILSELSGDALLEYAVDKGKYKLAKIALDRGATPKSRHRNITSCGMLYLAVRNNNPDFIPLLIQYGADVNEKCDNISVLECAVMNYYPECVKELLDFGAKINDEIIRMAKYCMHSEIYSMIYKTDKMPSCKDIPKDIDLKKCHQIELNQYLISAINAYDIEAVHRLLNAGANPNSQDSCKRFVLEIAVKKNAPDMIQALVDAGGDISKRTVINCSLLSYACVENQDKCVELLLKLGASEKDYSFEYSRCARIRKIWKKYKSKNSL